MSERVAKSARYRLGLDLGSTSIGWALLRLNEQNEPDYLIRVGVRIFSDGRKPKDGSSLAVERRMARQQRRRRDRLLRRKRRIIEALTEFGLWPQSSEDLRSLQERNPYELRARALSEKLSLHEIGRAIFHLNQRRGFRSSRKSDTAADDEKGQINSAIQSLRAHMKDSQSETVGAYLYSRLVRGEATRARRFGEGVNAKYDFYVDRSMTASEFDLIWERQAALHGADLSEAARIKLRDVLLYQRPLKPVRPGRCSLEPSEDRAPLGLPSVQRFRILQEVNNLRIRERSVSTERALSDVERELILKPLMDGRTLKFEQIRKLLGFKEARFNLESERRDELKGDFTTKAIVHAGFDKRAWRESTDDEQDALISILLDDRLTDEQALVQIKARGVTDDVARQLLVAKIPDGYGRMSLKAVRQLHPGLLAGLTYDKAVVAAGYPGTNSCGDGSLEKLPYYGEILEKSVAFGSGDPADSDELRYGRISNPSVHIALNQLRLLMNALIEKYGRPSQVVVELTRDLKLGWRRAREIERDQAKRQKDNDALRADLESLGQSINYDNLLRMRLFRELERGSGMATRCVYSGEQISLAQLFTPEIHIDHILPYARTLDDSIANKVLCRARVNAAKGDLDPFTAFSHSPGGYSWSDIQQRASELSRGRDRRFTEDAMARYLDEDAFLARQLTDTAYMSRVARQYLTAICTSVWSGNGSLTSMLRAKWGLNRLLSHDNVKNRLDHRHHAIDAVVIACTDRSTVQRIATAAGRAARSGADKVVSQLDHPWPTFLPGLENALNRVVVSHRPDHAVEGALHNDSAYGLREPDDGSEGTAARLVHKYVPLMALGDKKPENVRNRVADRSHALAIANLIETHAGSAPAIREALETYGRLNRIRRLRWCETITAVPITRRDQPRPYKYLKGDSNYCYEISLADGDRWIGKMIPTFDANQPLFRKHAARSREYRRMSFSGKPLVMRLIRNDIVALKEGAERRLYRVQKLSEGKVTLAYHTIAGDPTRYKLHIPDTLHVMTVAPSRLRDLKARRVFVDILGRVFDPKGQHARTDSGAR